MGKLKYRVSRDVQKKFSFPDFAIELTPIERRARKSDGFFWSIYHLIITLSNRLFSRTGFDFIITPRSLQCQLLLESTSLDSLVLTFDGDKTLIQNSGKKLDKVPEVVEFVIKALDSAGYRLHGQIKLDLRTAYHLMGSTPMGRSPSDSVVNFSGGLHGFPGVIIVCLSTLSTVGFVNPTFPALVQGRIVLKNLLLNSE
jgi:hypothetical protein